MRTNLYTLSTLLPLLLCACPGDDGDDPNTTQSMTSAASEGTGSTGTSAGTGSTGSSSEGGSVADTSTGTNPAVCDTCDPATEYCRESIIDGPTEYSCEPLPEECAADITCECITPIECPESLQSCSPQGELVVLECVDG